MTLSKTEESYIRAGLILLSAEIGAGNAERGFREQGDRLRQPRAASMLLSDEENDAAAGERADALRNYYITKLALIGTEVFEAVEELRNGRDIDERWYSDPDYPGNPGKPEGVPSELADIVIRCLDLADEARIGLADAILEKLAYNASRGFRHGGKTV